MRRLIILAVLLGLMAFLQTVQLGTDTTLNPLALVTFGFILLAAYTAGQIAAGAGLPKITGYIVTGLLFGPQVLNVFSSAVAEDLRVVNDLAIGLIALGAGGEMHLTNLRKIARSLTTIIVIKGLLILVSVASAVWALAPFIPFLDGQPTGLVLSVGMILGVLALGTSPAATIAVISETGAKGRLADTTLGVAVGKDIVMVILLAVGIALAGTFAPGGHGFEVEILTDLGKELGLSIVAGCILGAVIIAYMRYLGAELWLFLIAVVFAMTAIAQQFHLEALLTFIIGGFVVQNASEQGHDFVELVETVALPVFVVFFSAAGAGIDLTALQALGLVAVALVLVRLAAIWLGTRLATQLAGEPEEIRKNAWLAFVAQAGVVIGLSIIAEEKLPGLGAEIRTLVMGMVAIHLLVGPILFKLALTRAGEIESKGPAVEPREGRTPEDRVRALEFAPLAEHLASSVGRMEERVRLALDALGGAAARGPLSIARTLRETSIDDAAARERLEGDWDETLDAATQAFLEKAEQLCLEAPQRISVALEEHWYATARYDLGSERWRKRFRRLRRGLRRATGAEPVIRRSVPVRDLFLYHVKHALADDLQPLLATFAAQPALSLRDALQDTRGDGSPAEPDDDDERPARTEVDLSDPQPKLRAVLDARLTALRRDLALIGTGELPRGKRRPSRLLDRTERARERLADANRAWKDLALSVVRYEERRRSIERFRETLVDAFEAFEPELRVRFDEDVEAPLRRAREVLDEASRRIQQLEPSHGDEVEEGLSVTGEWTSAGLRREALAGLRRDLESPKHEEVLRRFDRALDPLIDALPESLRVVDPDDLPDPARPPRTYPKPAEYELRLIAKSLVERTVPACIERSRAQTSEALQNAERVVRVTRETLELRFEASVDEAMDEQRDARSSGPARSGPIGAPHAVELAQSALESAAHDLDAALGKAEGLGQEAERQFRTDVEALMEGLGGRLAAARPLGARFQAERARVELKGPTVMRLFGSRARKGWRAALTRLGLRHAATKGTAEAALARPPLRPAGAVGSDRALLFRILFESATPAGRAFDSLLIVTILASILVVMLDSVSSVSVGFGRPLLLLEWIFTLIFTLEYVGRLWAVDRPLRYALSFYGIIDLLAVIPTYVSLIVPGGQYLISIRVLRVLRVFRVFKLARYVGEAKVLGEALRASRFKITVFIVSVLTITIVMGSLMFLIEGPEAGFTSIPRGVYWGIVTLTTVGFGDITPVTPLGQTLAAMLMILGYGIIAVPTGIITAEMARTPTPRDVGARTCPSCSHPEDDPEARFCRACGIGLDRG